MCIPLDFTGLHLYIVHSILWLDVLVVVFELELGFARFYCMVDSLIRCLVDSLIIRLPRSIGSKGCFSCFVV